VIILSDMGDPIHFKVDWDSFPQHSSFFIPTLNTIGAKRVIKKVCRSKGIDVRLRKSIENDIQGVRVWRLT
jgi:hypothetical protein|tara:strand:- start:260 stop:472 length:213 start_codon:yes stop_codon:yes gene_type:complete